MASLCAILFCSLLLMLPGMGEAQLNQFVTTVAPGTTLWYPEGNGVGSSYTVLSDPPSGTITITTNPGTGGTATTVIAGRTIPTLVYNCYYMPFICKNIDNHIKNHGNWKFNNQGLMELHYDATENPSSANDRRQGTCKSKSQKNPSLYQAAGFPNKCKDAKTTWNINTVYSRQFPLGLPAESVNNEPKIILGPKDPNNPGSNLFSGLMWTCDEFPSASWIEGGRGKSGAGTQVDAEVICAPQSASCDKQSIPAALGAQQPVSANPSEQDWQSNALTFLRGAVNRTHAVKLRAKDSQGKLRTTNYRGPFVGVFFLSTVTQQASASRAWVIDEAQSTRVAKKRSLTTVNANTDSLATGLASGFGPHLAAQATATTPTSFQSTTMEQTLTTPLSTSTGGPGLLPSQNVSPSLRPGIVPKGVYHLRGRAVGAAQVQAAENLLAAVSPEIQSANARRLAYPRISRKGDGAKSVAQPVALDGGVPEPTAQDYLPINATVREAAALVAEFDARNGRLRYTWPLPGSHGAGNGTIDKRATAATTSSYWYSQISPKGKSPFNPAGSSYQVYKNVVTDCGAKGNGQDDDTQAIQDCIAAQNRCGGDSLNCTGTSVMPLVVYFPPGTYLISSHIEMYFQTTLLGDPITRPVLLAAPKFQGLGVLSSDYYIPGAGGNGWYVNQNNFMRQVRNFIIDIRNTPDNPSGVPPPGPACLHWQVAQATSLQNVDLYMKEGSRGHVGIFMENGSGGLITGVRFHGGFAGLRAGNQQFTIKDLNFTNTRTAIQAIWDWTFLWQNIAITGATVGIDLINQDLKNTAKPQQTFAYLLVDSTISATTGIRTNPFMANDGYAQLTLDNVDFAGSGTAIKQTTGEVVLAGAPHVDSWMWGIVATKDSPTGRQVKGEAAAPIRKKPQGLLGGPNGGYFDKPKPQYEDVAASEFRNALSNGCKGDGVADDTACLQNLLGSPGYVFIPAGVYRVTDTVKIVPGVKLVGEAYSAITASGASFMDMTSPHVMIQVGEPGQTGDVEISDMLFQVEQGMAGAVLVEWNIRARTPGSAGMWDSHFRVGGNAGSSLQAADCPRLSGVAWTSCIASSLMMHVTPWASGYFENVWGWAADHDLETKDAVQIDIYSGRGVLIQSTSPTWFYASAFEHNVLYQYMVRGARNLFLGLIQTESPYFQSSPAAPAPFGEAVGKFIDDPTFSGCRPGSTPDACMAWGLMIKKSSDVLIYGAGLYSWFQKYSQNCLRQFNCQDKMVYITGSKNIYIYNLATVGTYKMVTSPGTGADLGGLVHNSARSNVSSINAWLGDADGTLDDDGDNPPNATITLSMSIWRWPETQSDGKGTMTVACSPPCVFDFPPLTYPPLQPPPITTTINGRTMTITPPRIATPTIGWDPVTYNPSTTDGDVTTITPTPNMTAIPVPPWSCGAACDNAVATFPPIPLPPPMPTNAPCWALCNATAPHHPAVVIGPGPAPGPPPPPRPRPPSDTDTDNNNNNNPNATVYPYPYHGCTPSTCPLPCTGPACTQGTDCTGASCIAGGACEGAHCLRGGTCTGALCLGGGDCRGDACTQGGDCDGDSCEQGGGCVGAQCGRGGGCDGVGCRSGGGCEGPLCKGPGSCVGPGCGSGGCVGVGCGGGGSGGGCTGPNCGAGGCTGADCDPGPPGSDDDGGGGDGEGEDDDDDDDEEEDDEEDEDEEEDEYCFLRPGETPNVDTSDGNGMGVSGYTGSDSDSGGNVGQGGVDGSGTGCLDPDTGSIYPCQGSDDVTTTLTTWVTVTPTTTTPVVVPTPSPYYDCQGAQLCSTTNIKHCDEAVNNMQRGSKIYYADDDIIAVSGNCWANAEGFGCSVRIRGTDVNTGKNCQITGDNMWDTYQDIHKIAGCPNCGTKHFGNGCMVTVDYYYGCDNRDSGPDSISSAGPIS